MVQSFLTEYRKKHTVNKDTSKETLGSIFARARQVADASVALLRERLEGEVQPDADLSGQDEAQQSLEDNKA
jgi:hypothetical protein